MAFTLYQTIVPPTLQILKALSGVLDKAAAHCESRKIDPAVLIGARLYPDMFPLARQIQIVTDLVKGMMARLTDSEAPVWPDTEVSFAELQARLA